MDQIINRPTNKVSQQLNEKVSQQLSNQQSKQLFSQYLSNLSAESILLSAIEHILIQRSNILNQILTLEGTGPFKVNGRVFSIIKRYGKCHERELKEREIKVVA